MSDHLDPVLLAHWLAGDVTPAQQEAIDAWLAADPARRADLAEAREIWERAGDVVAREVIPGDDAAAAMARWNAVRQAIAGRSGAARRLPSSRPIEFPTLSRPSRLRRWGFAVAASVAMLAIGGRVAWQALNREPSQAENAVAALGRPTNLVLSDGSTVMLAPGSRLTFANPSRPGSIRAATLDGQAYFKVAHDARRPFVVTAGMVVTRVLGTEFNVRAYADDTTSVVTVRSGRVSVKRAQPGQADQAEVVITPGYGVRVGGRDEMLVKAVDVERALAWTAGRLEFVGADLTSVLQDVNRWYGTRVRLADTSLAHHRLTITFSGETKERALARLTRLLGSEALDLSSNPGSPR